MSLTIRVFVTTSFSSAFRSDWDITTPCSSSGDARSVFDDLWRAVRGTWTHQGPLSQHHNLSTRFILFHASMCLDDLLKMENLADLDTQCIRSDLFNQILKRRPHEIFRFAGIGGQ